MPRNDNISQKLLDLRDRVAYEKRHKEELTNEREEIKKNLSEMTGIPLKSITEEKVNVFLDKMEKEIDTLSEEVEKEMEQLEEVLENE